MEEERGVAVRARALRKSFPIPIPRPPDGGAGTRIRRRYRELVVLDGISFTVRKGESLGVVGRNGSGKSTLLKLLGGIFPPDGGELHVADGAASFVDLSAGFDSKLTVRENVQMKGIMLGLPRDVVRARMPHILDFAELTEFSETEFKRLSSGMRARLAFATMIEADPEILLLDEILSVGDYAFRQKCADVFTQYRRRGKTIVLVTHATGDLERLCDTAIMLEGGEIQSEGAPAEVVAHYDAMQRRAVGDGALVSELADGDDQVRARIESLKLAERKRVVQADASIDVVADLEVTAVIGNPTLRVELADEDGSLVFAPPPIDLLAEPGQRLRRGDRPRLRLEIENGLATGRYTLTCALTRTTNKGRQRPISAASSLTFRAKGSSEPNGGILRLRHSATLERKRRKVA